MKLLSLFVVLASCAVVFGDYQIFTKNATVLGDAKENVKRWEKKVESRTICIYRVDTGGVIIPGCQTFFNNDFPPLNGETEATCFAVGSIIDPNGYEIPGSEGTRECLQEITPLPGDILTLTDSTELHLPRGLLRVRLGVSVTPFQFDPINGFPTHVTGGWGGEVLPSCSTGIYRGTTGYVRLSGFIQPSDVGMAFDGIYTVTFNGDVDCGYGCKKPVQPIKTVTTTTTYHYEYAESVPSYNYEYAESVPKDTGYGYGYEHSESVPSYNYEYAESVPSYNYEYAESVPKDTGYGYGYEHSESVPSYNYEYAESVPKDTGYGYGYEHSESVPSYNYEYAESVPSYNYEYSESVPKDTGYGYGYEHSESVPSYNYEYEYSESYSNGYDNSGYGQQVSSGYGYGYTTTPKEW